MCGIYAIGHGVYTHVIGHLKRRHSINKMTSEFEINDFKILSTGVDGGHHYLSTIVDFNGSKRNMTVLFKSKSDEKRLEQLNSIKVKGYIQDEGSQFPLTLLDSELI
jgi:hypothetical protein